MAVTVILVRHGQTAWNQVERFRGRADVPLNDAGLKQAEAAGRRVAESWQPAAIYSSPLGRTRQTAAAIARHILARQMIDLGVQVYPSLLDIDYGAWQGLTPAEARQRWPEEVEAWYGRPAEVHIPGGESLADVRERGMAALTELTSRHPAETIVLVGHTVINRVILLGVLGLDNARFWHIQQDTGAINVFEADQGDFTLVSLNDTCHLGGG